MIAALLMLVAQAGVTAASDRESVIARAQPVVDHFYAAVRACGARPPFKPTIDVAERDGIIHYDPPTGQLVLYPWSVMNADVKAEHAMLAEDAGQTDGGREAYTGIFNELLVAHELGHWLQQFQPEVRTSEGKYDDWAAEYNANQIMIAFWRDHPLLKRPTEARLAAWLKSGAVERNAVPPPAGQTVEHFFNSDRMTIVRGGAYGWYMGEMTRRAFDERPKPTFCSLVSRWLPLR